MEIKETKEAVHGLLLLTKMLAEVFKDGVQAKDGLEVIEKLKAHPEILLALKEAYNGADQVLAEVKDIDMLEGLELAKLFVVEGMELVKVIKAEPKV